MIRNSGILLTVIFAILSLFHVNRATGGGLGKKRQNPLSPARGFLVLRLLEHICSNSISACDVGRARTNQDSEP